MKEQDLNEQIIEEISEEELKDFIDQITEKKEEKEEPPVEITREDFFLQCCQAFDFHVKNLRQGQKLVEGAKEQIGIIQGLVNSSNVFESDPNIRVVYLEYSNGTIGVLPELKDEMGFKHERDK